MAQVEVLDCTLRDGGYINNWNFDIKDVNDIINNLSKSGIEYIECGFINNISFNDEQKTIYRTPDECTNILNIDIRNSRLAFMMKVGEYDIDLLKMSSNDNDIIRLSFHKNDIDLAIDYAIKIKSKGYALFFQPTAINNYTSGELIELSKICNTVIKPECFGIVDTLGVLTHKDIEEISNVLDKHLNQDIKLALHCHDNMKNAYSNSVSFINNMKERRNIIVDATILGMGRNSGNLCTEIITNFLNQNVEYKYDYNYILKTIDENIMPLKRKYEWGYSPYCFLNAKNGVHPKYLDFFKQKTKKLVELDQLFSIIPYNKRIDFDKKCAQKVLECYYYDTKKEYMSYELIKRIVLNKDVLINTRRKKIASNYAIVINILNNDIAEMVIPSDTEMKSYRTLTISFTADNKLAHFSFNSARLLKEQILSKTDDIVVFLLHIFSKSMCKSIVLINYDYKKCITKYKITQDFNALSQAKHLNLINEYINIYSKSSNIKLFKEDYYENSSSCTD